LSGGRVELIIGKGNGPEQAELFGIGRLDAWDTIAENYKLLRQLWSDHKVTWTPPEGVPSIRTTPLTDAEVHPRPLQPTIRIWHGSATAERSVELAAEFGDPVFSANGMNPVTRYAELIRHYRSRWAEAGRDPAEAPVGAGHGQTYVTRNSQDAVVAYRPVYERFAAMVANSGHSRPRSPRHCARAFPTQSGPSPSPSSGTVAPANRQLPESSGRVKQPVQSQVEQPFCLPGGRLFTGPGSGADDREDVCSGDAGGDRARVAGTGSQALADVGEPQAGRMQLRCLITDAVAQHGGQAAVGRGMSRRRAHPGTEGFGRRGIGQEPVAQAEKRVVALVQQAADQCPAGRKVPVERSDGDSRPPGDELQRGVGAVLKEDGISLGEQALVVAACVGAKPALSWLAGDHRPSC
jgi:Luciferase-like monooxygenase